MGFFRRLLNALERRLLIKNNDFHASFEEAFLFIGSFPLKIRIQHHL